MRHAGTSAADDWPRRQNIPGGNGLLQEPTPAPAPPQARSAPPQPERPELPEPARESEPIPEAAPPPAAKKDGGGKRPRLYVIDGLRLFAAMFVAIHHYVGTNRADQPHNSIWDRPASHVMPSVWRLATYGYLGVEIFFVISGFVICMSCWGRRPRDFFVSRVIRLYPAYWFGVLFTTAVLTAYPVVWGKPTGREVLFNLSMLQGGSHVANVDGVYWTLWSELRFYLVFLVVVATGLTYRKVVVFCCVWGAMAALAPAAGFPALSLIADRDSTWYFIAGLSLYLMHRFGQDLLLWGILVLSWIFAQDEIGRRISGVEHVSGWRGALLIYTVFLLFMVCVALGFTDRIQWKWLVTAGSLTYPFYLLHYAAGATAIHYLRDRADPRVLVAGLIVVFLLLSYLVHRLVERPVAKLLKRGLTKAFDNLGTVPKPGTGS